MDRTKRHGRVPDCGSEQMQKGESSHLSTGETMGTIIRGYEQGRRSQSCAGSRPRETGS